MSDSSDIRVEVTNAGSQAVSVINATGSTPTVTDGASVTVHVAGGPTGVQGVTGPTGPQGLSITGPTGPQGVAGNSGNLGDLADVQASSVAAGDLLRYSNGKWRNTPESTVTDGGNF